MKTRKADEEEGRITQDAIEKDLKKKPQVLKPYWEEFVEKMNGMDYEKYARIGRLLQENNREITAVNAMRLHELPNFGKGEWLFREVKK